jgi:hypothetical protein
MNAKTDDLDMPEFTEQMATELKAKPAVDLHLGAGNVKSWAEQHGPQPPGSGLRALDYLVLAMFAASVILMVRACSWVVAG